MRVTAKRGEREQALEGLRAPTSRSRSGGYETGSVDALSLERSGESHSTRTLLESPPRLEDCPMMLACWYFGSPPAASICACREAATVVFSAARAAVRCFCRVWWVRIKLRVAWEESVARFWMVGGRLWESSPADFLRFLVGIEK